MVRELNTLRRTSYFNSLSAFTIMHSSSLSGLNSWASRALKRQDGSYAVHTCSSDVKSHTSLPAMTPQDSVHSCQHSHSQTSRQALACQHLTSSDRPLWEPC